MIAEMVTIAVDTACLLLAFGAGVRISARRTRPPKEQPKKLTCGCTHELAYHDPKSGVCHQQAMDRTYTKLKNGTTVFEDHLRQCACKVYTGELPDDWYARILTGSEDAA